MSFRTPTKTTLIVMKVMMKTMAMAMMRKAKKTRKRGACEGSSLKSRVNSNHYCEFGSLHTGRLALPFTSSPQQVPVNYYYS